MSKVVVTFDLEDDVVNDLEPTPTVTVSVSMPVSDARLVAKWRTGYARFMLGDRGPDVVTAIGKQLSELDG